MTATHAQVRAVQLVRDVLFQHAPQDSLKVLTNNQRGAVITDWLTQGVKLNDEELEHLGNYLSRQAWMMRRDNNA